MLKKAFVVSVLFVCASSLIAQEAPPENSAAPPTPARRGRMPHCLHAAGISMSVFDQLRSVEREARAQVRGVCTNTSLTQQEKRGQIQEIHQSSHQKMAGLVTPDQSRAFMACRAQHGDRRPVEWFERPGGGCGAPRKAAISGYESPSHYPLPNENNAGENSPPVRNAAPPQKGDSSAQ
jgi:hypothetical protein